VKRALLFLLVLGCRAAAAQSGWGEFTDRSARDAEWKKLSPADQAAAASADLSNPEVGRRLNQMSPEERQRVRAILGEIPTNRRGSVPGHPEIQLELDDTGR
jgi:hypothetical protein